MPYLSGPQTQDLPLPLIEPSASGYLQLAAAVDPPRQPGPPFPRRSERRAVLLTALKTFAAQVEVNPLVRKATVYRAVLVPPAGRVATPARYDVAVLVETTSPETVGDVQAGEAWGRLVGAVTDAAQATHVMAARCLRRIADVDRTREGLFLFNYFTAEDREVAVEVWDRVAGWYVKYTGLDNSTLLEPTGDDPFVFVNHARWDDSLPTLMVQQFARPSFWTYVRSTLSANGVVAQPVLYRLA